MQSISKRILLPCCAALLVMQAGNLWADCCNFGTLLTRKRIVLHRRLLPVVSLADTSVKVLVASPQGQQNALDSEIQAKVENILTSSDSHVTVGDAQSQYLLRATVTQYSAPKIDNVKEGKNTIQRCSGNLTAVFRVTNERNGQLATSGDVRSTITRDQQQQLLGGFHMPSIPVGGNRNSDSNSSGASPADVERDLVSDVANQIASYIVNTSESITVFLARGDALDSASRDASEGLWSKYDEALETMTPLSEPADAYRRYNIGVANEAMAYQAEDPNAAKTFLRKANREYDKAVEEKGDEKYFTEAKARLVSAVKRYEGNAGKSSVHEPPKEGGASKVDPPPQDNAMTNADVVQMVQAKMDEANILDNIQNAPSVAFDLTYGSQVQLTKSGVNGKVLAAMKQRARAGAPGAAAEPKPKPKQSTPKH